MNGGLPMKDLKANGTKSGVGNMASDYKSELKNIKELTFAKWFDGELKRTRVKLQEISDFTGVSRQTVSKWKNGHSTPTDSQICDMIKFFANLPDHNSSGKNKIQEKRDEIGMSRKEMSAALEIPLRTLENWDNGVNQPAAWVEKLILEKLDTMKK